MNAGLHLIAVFAMLLPQAPQMPLGQPKMALDLVVTGPKDTEPGDLVILDASNSQGVSAGTWYIAPTEAFGRMLVVENGQKVVFATSRPGPYTFFYSACTADGKTIRIVPYVVVVRGTPPPNPNPPVPPNPNPPPPVPPPGPTPLGLTQFVIDEAAKVTDPNKAAVAAQAATACDVVVSQIGAGVLKTPDEIHAAFRQQLTNVGFFQYLTYWKSFLGKLATKFDALGLGKDSTTKEQWSQAFTEIGAGFRQVR